jgi:flagellar biosynthesis/type III secretory pathway protein FliH
VDLELLGKLAERIAEHSERAAMALEGIEQAITRQADAQESALREQRDFIEQQQEQQKQMAARLGLVGGRPANRGITDR